MGEIADWMLEGGLCQGCGVYLGEGDGYPTFCRDCARDQPAREPQFSQPKNVAKVACKVCGRHVKAVGLNDHIRDSHGQGKG